MSDKFPVKPSLVTAHVDAGTILIVADGRAVLSLSITLALDLMARIAVACKDAIKGRP